MKIVPKLNRIKRDIISVIKKSMHKSCKIGSVDVPDDAEEDGMITVVDGIRIDHQSYIKAADARTLQKRVNAIAEGMWTLNQRLNLTVETRHENRYRQITIDEEHAIIKVCIFLDGKDTSNERIVEQLKKKVRSCMSKKLKNDRYRHAGVNSARTKKKQGPTTAPTYVCRKADKVQGKSNSKNDRNKREPDDGHSHESDDSKERQMEIKSSEKPLPSIPSTSKQNALYAFMSDEENSCSSKPIASTVPKKYKRLQVHYISSTESDSDNNTSSNDTRIEKIGTKILLDRLILKLSPSICKFGRENVHHNAYSWQDLKVITNFTEEEMKSVFTPDCCVILEEKCRIIDPLYEYQILQYMCKLARDREYDFGNMKMANIVAPTKEIYPEAIVKYVFAKYTVATFTVPDELLFRWEVEKIIKLKLYNHLQQKHEWNYNDLRDEFQNELYCDNVEMSDEIVSEARGIVERPNHRDTSDWKVKRKDAFSTITGLDILMTNYNRLFEKQL